MAKVKAKDSGVQEGTKILDLSPEKRSELYQEALKKFDQEGVATYGITIDVELVFNKKGVVPRLVLVDVLTQKQNEEKAKQVQAKPKA